MQGKTALAPVACEEAELVGFDFSTGKAHACGMRIPESGLRLLTLHLNSGKAFVICPWVAKGSPYNNIVCWPGVGVFAVRLSMDNKEYATRGRQQQKNGVV